MQIERRDPWIDGHQCRIQFSSGLKALQSSVRAIEVSPKYGAQFNEELGITGIRTMGRLEGGDRLQIMVLSEEGVGASQVSQGEIWRDLDGGIGVSESFRVVAEN